jgi:hypothetical protein
MLLQNFNQSSQLKKLRIIYGSIFSKKLEKIVLVVVGQKSMRISLRLVWYLAMLIH